MASRRRRKQAQRERRPAGAARSRTDARAKPVAPPVGRKVDAAARREAILDAALTVFARRGYEAARLDDVASMAGVAKGTLYLYFKDKEALFEALVRGAVSPILAKVGEAAAAPGMKPADVLDLFFSMFQAEVLGTKRKLLLRLIISEGPRFPALAELYYREVVSRGLKLMGAVQRKGVTLVPLSIYFNDRGVAKVELALATGKRQHDKRDTVKERDWQRSRQRLLRGKG